MCGINHYWTALACLLMGFATSATAATPRQDDLPQIADEEGAPINQSGEAIDREALFQRHSPRVAGLNPLSPFTVGNGSFAFTADITGLQSFPEAYVDGIPLAIQSEWGWHSFPNTEDYRIDDTYELFESGDRKVLYPTLQHSDAGQWLRGNPHRLGLGRIGFRIRDSRGDLVSVEQIEAIDQRLDLWRGQLHSRFEVEGQPVSVVTVCHPTLDLIAVSVESPLLSEDQLAIIVEFAYGTSDWGIDPGDWDSPDKHTSSIVDSTAHRAEIARMLDKTRYAFAFESAQPSQATQEGPHTFVFSPSSSGNTFAFTTQFAPSLEELEANAPAAGEAVATTGEYWPSYWSKGGAIDLSQSSDPRAAELERRIVLSQYLTAIQCRGALPPQETGLTFNSWYGKPHLEMHWWHGAHFALWDRLPALENTLQWYQKILPKAQEIAATQGYQGARWPKNVDPAGNQAPSTIAPLLIWQQPHPIYFAELVYRQRPEQATLSEYGEIVAESAEFMASFVRWDDTAKAFVLGPPLIPAQESYEATTTSNPPFELAYWRWGLETAQKWRERQGLERNDRWDRVLAELAPYPEFEDVYATAEGVWNTIDHPTVLGAYGMLPGDQIDIERMDRTLDRVRQEWNWGHTWGWDYPLVAMTAARLGRTENAIEALLMDVPKNRYLPNGHNWQEPERLRIYLPGNGGLLAAVAMMAAGWDGAPDCHAPGFPQDGSWTVVWENLHPMP